MPWFIPLLIFLARICDVSIGTVRVILVIRGRKVVAAMLGFVESIIWITATSQVVLYIREGLWPILAYGGGFATGTLIGMLIEQALALGEQVIRVINPDVSRPLARKLREMGHRVTVVEGQGAKGRVEICFLAVRRKQAKRTMRQVLDLCPDAFMTVGDVRETTSSLVRVERSKRPAWLRIIKFK